MIYDVCVFIHLKTIKRQDIELKMNELSILSLLHRKHNFKLHFVIKLKVIFTLLYHYLSKQYWFQL